MVYSIIFVFLQANLQMIKRHKIKKVTTMTITIKKNGSYALMRTAPSGFIAEYLFNNIKSLLLYCKAVDEDATIDQVIFE